MTERRFASQIGPWTEWTGITDKGALYATWALQGVASELADLTGLDAVHGALNHNAIQHGHHTTEWYLHFTRAEQAGMTPLPACDGWFARQFDAAYTECLGGKLYRNGLWFTLVKRPSIDVARNLREIYAGARRMLFPKVVIPYAEAVFLDEFEELAARLGKGLAALGAKRLAAVEMRHGKPYSPIDEALHLILHNFWREIPVTRGRAAHNITPYKMKFGEGTWETQVGPAARRYGTIFGIQTFPAQTRPEILDDLKRASLGMTITNSSAWTRRSISISALGNKVKQMVSAGEPSTDDTKDVKQAENKTASGLNIWGSTQFSVAVHSRESLVDLDRKGVIAEGLLSNAGISASIETQATKAAFYAQAWGNNRWRTRPQRLPSDVFCDFAAPHNVPTARYEGRWGAPALCLRTTADTEIYFHPHVQDSPQVPAEDLGSMAWFGPSGSGKTGAMGAFAQMSAFRQGARTIIVDKGFGLAPMIHANDGTHIVFRDGEPTGASLLRGLKNTPAHIAYIVKTIRALMQSDGKGEIDGDDEVRLRCNVELQMQMPPELRELAAIAIGFGPASVARMRLRRWCWGETLGWVMDCRADTWDLTKLVVGFETGSLLKNDHACSPLLNLMFFRTTELINGQPLAFYCDEYWSFDKNEAFAADTDEKLATIRKSEGIVGLATQNPRTALKSRYAHTFRQQIPTKCYFADADAHPEDLAEMGLSYPEINAVRGTDASRPILASRRHQFLMKRPGWSGIVTFDMGKRPDMIAVISGRDATYNLMLELKQQYGPAPQQWVPHFQRIAPGIVDRPPIIRPVMELVA
jgi:type IV secretion system protein VirB4